MRSVFLIVALFLGACKNEHPNIDSAPQVVPNNMIRERALNCASIKVGEWTADGMSEGLTIRNQKLAADVWQKLADVPNLTPAKEVNWAVPLYVIFLDSTQQVVGAFVSDRNRTTLIPLRGLESVGPTKRERGRAMILVTLNGRKHDLGINAAEEITLLERLLANVKKSGE